MIKRGLGNSPQVSKTARPLAPAVGQALVKNDVRAVTASRRTVQQIKLPGVSADENKLGPDKRRWTLGVRCNDKLRLQSPIAITRTIVAVQIPRLTDRT